MISSLKTDVEGGKTPSQRFNSSRTQRLGSKPRKNHRWNWDDVGFTRLDLIGAVAGVSVVGLVAAAGLDNSNSRSQRIVCANNLSRLAQSHLTYANDNDLNFIWRISSTGGSYGNPSNSQHFRKLRSYVPDFKTLVCPSDITRSPASSLTVFGNANVSYGIGTDCVYDDPTTVLLSDRDIEGSVPAGCGLAGGITVSSYSPPHFSQRWSATNHVQAGNMAFTDGSVLQLSNSGLRDKFTQSRDSQNDNHLLQPLLPGE